MSVDDFSATVRRRSLAVTIWPPRRRKSRAISRLFESIPETWPIVAIASGKRQAVASIVADRPWDLLVNIAGVQHFGPLGQQTPEHLLASYMVNLVTPARLAQAVLPGMKQRGRGQIANVGSIFGSINFAHFATYSSAKAGMRALSQSLRRELAGTGIDVTYVAPRAVATPFNSDRVNEFARLTGMAVDDPDHIARRIVGAIRKNRRDVYLGFPESLFVRINALAPGLIDGALKSNDLKARALFAG
jgi:short-subunit dehydrogenase